MVHAFLTGISYDSYAQLITVLVIFAAVLALTAFVTKYIAGYQKQINVNSNIEVLETVRITTNKYLQLVRVGGTYIAIAVCRDTVTMLCEIPEEQLKEREAESPVDFKELLSKVMHKEPKE